MTLKTSRPITTRGVLTPWEQLPAHGPIMRPTAAATYFGVSISTYYELIHAGVVPAFIKLSHRARASGVPKAWLDAAIAARAEAHIGNR